jgi:hypothetical protein
MTNPFGAQGDNVANGGGDFKLSQNASFVSSRSDFFLRKF